MTREEVAQAFRPAIAALKRCATTVTLVLLAYATLPAQQAARVSGGNGTFYIGGYPNLIWISSSTRSARRAA